MADFSPTDHEAHGSSTTGVSTGTPTRHGRHEPTVIVSRRARPGRERELERWLRRLVTRVATAPGYVDAELQPPNSLHPGEWVVVYRFTDAGSLESWLQSPVRLAMMATGDDLVENASEQVVALAPDPVTAVSSIRVDRSGWPNTRCCSARSSRLWPGCPGSYAPICRAGARRARRPGGGADL